MRRRYAGDSQGFEELAYGAADVVDGWRVSWAEEEPSEEAKEERKKHRRQRLARVKASKGANNGEEGRQWKGKKPGSGAGSAGG